MANDIWCNMFQYATVECLTTTVSDHYPLLLECDPKPVQHRHLKHFKFENAWLVEPDFDPFVKQHWGNYGSMNITRKLDNCASDLTSWSKDNCNKTRKEIEKCKKNLERARLQTSPSNINYFNALRKRLDTLLVKDDMYWRQRAKTFWYREGDLNTRYFHAAATSRKQVNRINYLEDANGDLCRDLDGMKG
ncbi:endonuclease/exonuclease/phosphatase family protein, partial [Trifolium medium]|nr:endonuclease/exonuclease/phosphatase family protein [Trifolium medium]